MPLHPKHKKFNKTIFGKLLEGSNIALSYFVSRNSTYHSGSYILGTKI